MHPFLVRLLAALALCLPPSLHALETRPAPTPEPPPVPGVPEAHPPSDAPAQAPGVLRVNVTSQAFSFSEPWTKQAPIVRQGLGVVLKGGGILVTGELVANHTYVELEKAETAVKSAATVEAVDYDANLALLRASDPEFLEGITPAELDDTARVGDRVEVIQLEANGTILATAAAITTIEVGRYPMEDAGFLLFRLSVPLQSRDNSFTLPAFKDRALVGMLMRYDPRTQTADVVPPPVIRHFLAAAASPPYAGFPRAGIGWTNTRDPQLRRYLRMPPGGGGVYVTEILGGSPAEKAGIRRGDVLLRIGGREIDQDGNYRHPRYGRISLAHLTNTESKAGDRLPVVLWRDGREETAELALAPRDAATVVSEPYTIDRPPNFLIAGGIIFQELSRQYLRDWGPHWRRDAPLRLVYLDRYQHELPPDNGRIVFISGVLPGESTIGYENLRYQIVRKVNGREIRGLRDLEAALETPADRFHRIELEEDPGLIFLDPERVKEDERVLQEQYRLPALKYIE